MARSKFWHGEIQDPEKRELAKQALCMLWDAMDLSNGGGGIQLPDQPSKDLREAYWRLYGCLGGLLLGSECPEHEVKT
jgi:hypothetical protein